MLSLPWVIPGSHTMEPFPSGDAVDRLKRQIPVEAGNYIVLDAMTYHAGGVNRTQQSRRAVNHVFTIPALRQQIHFPHILGERPQLTGIQRKILGYELREHRTYGEWFEDRQKRS